MGKMIEQVAQSRGHEIALVVDPALDPSGEPDAPRTAAGEKDGQTRRATSLSPDLLAGVDVAIEFSLPDAVEENVAAYLTAGVPVVMGTTGWLDRVDAVTRKIEEAGGALLYGANFSIGAHIFFRTAETAAALIADLPEYDMLVHEMHHRNKKDSPSGTALTLAERLLSANPRKSRIETGRLDRAPEPEELHVSSTRGGAVPGTHTLFLDSAADTVEVRHTARSREGFALGAVRGAEWVAGKKGVFQVEQFVTELLGR
jgi:4-hydroxy-tetrahydrodipicolinate reductase